MRIISLSAAAVLAAVLLASTINAQPAGVHRKQGPSNGPGHERPDLNDLSDANKALATKCRTLMANARASKAEDSALAADMTECHALRAKLVATMQDQEEDDGDDEGFGSGFDMPPRKGGKKDGEGKNFRGKETRDGKGKEDTDSKGKRGKGKKGHNGTPHHTRDGPSHPDAGAMQSSDAEGVEGHNQKHGSNDERHGRQLPLPIIVGVAGVVVIAVIVAVVVVYRKKQARNAQQQVSPPGYAVNRVVAEKLPQTLTLTLTEKLPQYQRFENPATATVDAQHDNLSVC